MSPAQKPRNTNERTEMIEDQPLPGLEPPTPPKTAIEEACDEFLTDLDASDGMTPLRKFLGEILRSQAQVIAIGSKTAKTSAVNAIPNILAIVQAMKLDTGDDRKADQLAALMDEIKASR